MHHLDSLLSSFLYMLKYRIKQRQDALFRFIAFNIALQSKYRIKQRQNAPFRFIAFKTLCLSKYRFKQRQNAPFRFIAFIFSLHIKISYYLAEECIIQIHCFQHFSACRTIVSNSDRMHHLDLLLSIFSLQVKCCIKLEAECTISLRFQTIASKCNNHRPYFRLVILNTVSNSVILLCTIIHSLFSPFPYSSKSKYHHNLDTLFSFCVCSSKSFQIPPDCLLQRHVFIFFFDLILLQRVCIIFLPCQTLLNTNIFCLQNMP